MFNAKKALSKLMKTPMVVESGTTSGWIWRKWSDGTADCRKYTTFAAASGTVTATIGLPFAFVDNSYLVFITPRRNFAAGQAIAPIDTNGNNAQTTTTFAMTWFKSGYNYAGDFSMYVVGRWK